MQTVNIASGQHNHDWNDDATCIFGCGSAVDSDTGICPTCKEHSQNVVTCDGCDCVGVVDVSTGAIEVQK